MTVLSTAETPIHRKVYQKKGASILFTCPYLSINHKMKWLGPPQFTTYTYKDSVKRSLPRSERLSVVGNHSAGEYNLEIRNVSLIDIGEYRCMTTNDTSPVTADFCLELYSKLMYTLQCLNLEFRY